MLARLVGFQNFQHLPANPFTSDRFNRSEAPRLFEFFAFNGRCATFDTEEGLRRWPSKRKLQTLSLWVFRVFFFESATFSEPEINLYSNHRYRFSEAALLRQDFILLNMMRYHHHGANYFEPNENQARKRWR